MQVQSEQGYVPTRPRKQKQGQGVPKSKTKEYSYTKGIGKKKGKKYSIKDYKPGKVRPLQILRLGKRSVNTYRKKTLYSTKDFENMNHYKF